jgi:hypothetical protein
MKKLFILCGLIMFMTANAYCQPAAGKITLEKKRYHQNGKTMTSSQLKTTLSGNQASAPEYMKSKANMNIAAPMIIAGSVCVLAGSAISLASSIKEANELNSGTYSGDGASGLGLILLGLVIDVAAIPLIIPANKHLKKSIELYNSSLSNTGYRKVQVNMMVTSTGLGVRMNF